MPNGQSLKYLNEWTELWRLTDTLYDRQLKRWGLSLNAYFVLCLLLDTPEDVEPAVIADKVSILRQSVTVLLNDFEKRKLIVRKESKEDHRRKKILFTPGGRKFAEKVCGEITEIELEAIAGIPQELQHATLEMARTFYLRFKAITENRA